MRKTGRLEYCYKLRNRKKIFLEHEVERLQAKVKCISQISRVQQHSDLSGLSAAGAEYLASKLDLSNERHRELFDELSKI